MLTGLLVVLAVLSVRGRFDDPDMWWHLRTGQIIWTTHTVPLADQFSYTSDQHVRIPHEWLAQVLIYGAYRLGGYPGLMLWLCLLSAALLIASYVLCWTYSGNAKVGFLGALIIWLFATSGLSIRPQMIGYLLLILELLLLHLGRTRNPRRFFFAAAAFCILGELPWDVFSRPRHWSCSSSLFPNNFSVRTDRPLIMGFAHATDVDVGVDALDRGVVA